MAFKEHGSQLSVADEIQRVFDWMDKDSKGYITADQLSGYLQMQRFEAKALITEVKVQLNGSVEGDATLTMQEFAAIIEAVRTQVEVKDPLEFINPRVLKRYRKVFDDIDVDSAGTITIAQLGQGMPGLDDMFEDEEGEGGVLKHLTFKDFAQLLHRAETSGAGRALAAALEETAQGTALIDAVRGSDSDSSRLPRVSVQELPLELMQVWDLSKGPDGLSSTAELQDKLLAMQHSGELLVSDEDLLGIIQSLAVASTSANMITFDVYQEVLSPLVDDGMHTARTFASSVASTARSMDSDYMPEGMPDLSANEEVAFQMAFDSLAGHQGVEHGRMWATIQAKASDSHIDQYERIFYFNLVELMGSFTEHVFGFESFATLLKEAEENTQMQLGDEWCAWSRLSWLTLALDVGEENTLPLPIADEDNLSRRTLAEESVQTVDRDIETPRWQDSEEVNIVGRGPSAGQMAVFSNSAAARRDSLFGDEPVFLPPLEHSFQKPDDSVEDRRGSMFGGEPTFLPPLEHTFSKPARLSMRSIETDLDALDGPVSMDDDGDDNRLSSMNVSIEGPSQLSGFVLERRKSSQARIGRARSLRAARLSANLEDDDGLA